jgi:uncharacterized phage protein (TIGR01671 family)
MNREMKFRAWDYLTGKMLTPTNTIGDDVCPPMVWCQEYTGLKDKHGREIYEGDIVRYEEWSLDKKWVKISLIEWIDGRDGDGYRMTGFMLPTFEDDSLEVIGNIFENQELMKEVMHE